MRLDLSSLPLWAIALIVLAQIIVLIPSIAKSFTIIAGLQKKDQNSVARIIVQQRKIASSSNKKAIPRYIFWSMWALIAQSTYFAIDIAFWSPPVPDRYWVAGTLMSVALLTLLSVHYGHRYNRRLRGWQMDT